jgi:hypothetical protein
LRYALRIWNGKEKRHDMEKIAHYAEMSWNMKGEELVKDGVKSDGATKPSGYSRSGYVS